MKRFLSILIFSMLAADVYGQISITSADVPVVGDTLRYSTAIPVGFNVNLNDTGANKVWNFDTMTPVSQGLDEYKLAITLGHVGSGMSASAYGYKVADTFGGAGSTPLPVTITDVYTFFNKKGTAPGDRYVAEGFGAKLSGLPITAAYDNEDELFFFPLEYGDKDTSDYYLNVNVPTLGRMVQEGERITHVDAWGTITTPYFATAKNCIRVRSEVNGIDSVIVTSFPVPPVGIPRQTVDYYWLVQGEHYPALWITTTMVGGTETVSSVSYRDSYRGVSVTDAKANKISKLEAFPNPARDVLQLSIPGGHPHYLVEVFNVQGRLVATVQNENTVNIASLGAGIYVARVSLGNEVAYATFVKP